MLLLDKLNKYFKNSGISLCDCNRCGSKCKYAKIEPNYNDIEVRCYCIKFREYLYSENYNFIRSIKCKLLYPFWLIKMFYNKE